MEREGGMEKALSNFWECTINSYFGKNCWLKKTVITHFQLFSQMAKTIINSCVKFKWVQIVWKLMIEDDVDYV